MQVIPQARPAPTAIPGVAHATWAGQAHGLSQLSVWRQTLDAGAATPPHRHDCDEVVLCLGGCGELLVDGQRQPFGADSTLILPRGQVHQILNAGPMPLELVGLFPATPVAAYWPDGAELALPWAS